MQNFVLLTEVLFAEPYLRGDVPAFRRFELPAAQAHLAAIAAALKRLAPFLFLFEPRNRRSAHLQPGGDLFVGAHERGELFRQLNGRQWRAFPAWLCIFWRRRLSFRTFRLQFLTIRAIHGVQRSFTTMQMFTIDTDNNITALLPGQEPSVAEGVVSFSSAADLHNLLSDWPMSRLLDLWNSIPGNTRVKKFMDRKTAVSRIYKAAESLTVGAQPAAEAPEAAAGGNGASPAEPEAQVTARRETMKSLAKKDRAKRAELKKARAETARKGFAKALAGAKTKADTAQKGSTAGGKKKPVVIVSGDTAITGKRADVLKLISQKDGATLAQLMKETGWQAHSIRGMISTLQSKDGVKIESFKPEGGERTYQVTAPTTRKAKAGK